MRPALSVPEGLYCHGYCHGGIGVAPIRVDEPVHDGLLRRGPIEPNRPWQYAWQYLRAPPSADAGGSYALAPDWPVRALTHSASRDRSRERNSASASSSRSRTAWADRAGSMSEDLMSR